MAKRSRSSARPGQRRRLDRTADRPKASGSGSPSEPTSAPVSRGSALTDAELARAAELEAQIVAEERATEAAAAAKRNPAGPRARGRAVVSSEPLSVRAAHEYAYVARDVRRIGIVAAIMFGALLVLHYLINIAGVLTI